jgi:hypothetical protein
LFILFSELRPIDDMGIIDGLNKHQAFADFDPANCR